MIKKSYIVFIFIELLILFWLLNCLLNCLYNLNSKINDNNSYLKKLNSIADETRKVCNRDYNKLLKITKDLWQ